MGIFEMILGVIAAVVLVVGTALVEAAGKYAFIIAICVLCVLGFIVWLVFHE